MVKRESILCGKEEARAKTQEETSLPLPLLP
jgi:hypothetical protein